VALRGGILAVLLGLAGAGAAAEPYSPPEAGVGCGILTPHAYEEIPLLFQEMAADSLLNLLDRWDTSCGPHEVIERTRILGAIWDDAFAEDLYDADIIGDLATRAEEMRRGDAPDSARARFDAFTVGLADQLLPHQEPESLEAFYCLFYGGHLDAARDLLDSDALQGTYLVVLAEFAREQSRAENHWTLAGAFGSWDPSGSLDWVGDQPLVGVNLGVRGRSWLARLLVEFRPGRTDRPYWVNRDGTDYLSDRFDAWLLGGEIGRRIDPGGPWDFQVIGGLGVDMIRPLGSDDLLLSAGHASVGVGLRSRLEADRGWVWGLDLRHEWIGDRNEESINLGGRAWSLRLVLEWLFERGPSRRRDLLSP
jgi:hypothetical protein